MYSRAVGTIMAYKSNLKIVQRKVVDVVSRNMEAACIHAQGEIVDIISRPRPKARVGGIMKGLDPSKPGEPPKIVTSLLHGTISYGVKKSIRGVQGFVGVLQGLSDKYGFFLEMGTSKMEPRPFVRRVVIGDRKKIMKIIATGIK